MKPAARQTLLISLALAPLAAALAAMFYLPDADGLVRRGGEIQAYAGADFVNMYEGARAVIEGDPGRLADFARYNATLVRDFGPIPFHSWSYPPHMLLLVAPFGFLPYGAAFALWQGLTFALLLWSVWPPRAAGAAARERLCVGAAIAFAPAVLLNLACGQNGFLGAALFIGGFRLAGSRPLLAGALFGVLTVKPQFGVAIPLALAMLGAWRTIAAAAATAVGMAALSILCFGVDPWIDFIGTTMPHQMRLVASMDGFYALMMPTPVAALRLAGFAPQTALAGHALVAAVAMAACAALLRRDDDWPRRAFVTAIATTLIAPYFFNYDMVAVGALAALTLARGDWRAAPAPAAAATLMLAAPAATMHLAIAGAPFGFALAGLALALMTPRAEPARTPAGRLALV